MAHASNGEGSITRRADGRWQLAWFELGQRKYAYVRGSRRDARARLRAILDRTGKGWAGVDSRSPLADWAEHWVADILPMSLGRSGQPLSPKTIATYASAMRAVVIPELGRVPLDGLSPLHVQHMEAQTAAKHSASYAHSCHKALSRCLADAIRARLLAVNVCAEVTAPRGKPKPKPTPDPEHVLALLAAAHDARMRAFVATLGWTGLRISEALGLRWSDVDWRAGSITVMGKGSRQRTIPLAPTLRAEWETWRTEQRHMRMAAPWWGDGDWLLSSEIGTQWDTANARKQFRPLAAKVLPGITPHSLRHATATLLLRERVPAKVVADLLGHSSTRVTLEVYSHVDLELMATATDTLDRALTSALTSPRTGSAPTVALPVPIAEHELHRVEGG